MSREDKEAMFIFLSIFRKNGIVRYMGEHVLVLLEELLGVCRHLDAIGTLLDKHVIDILTGLTICGNFCFRNMFCHL